MSTAERPPYAEAHDPNPQKPSVPVPAHACDTHAHVFGPGNTYPFIANGLYTPADALPSDFRHMLDTLGMERAVLVQPPDQRHGVHEQPPGLHGMSEAAGFTTWEGHEVRRVCALGYAVGCVFRSLKATE